MRPVLVESDHRWSSRFEEIAALFRSSVPAEDVVSIAHIGSTAVPHLAAKDIVDVQVSVRDLRATEAWPDEIGPFLRIPSATDHLPPGREVTEGWSKALWWAHELGHVHVREVGSANERYALLFRDYLRAAPAAAEAYEQAKRHLAAVMATTSEYAEAKDPVCDLVFQAAELWATATSWVVPR